MKSLQQEMRVLKEGQETSLKNMKTMNGRFMSLNFLEMMYVFSQLAPTSGSPMMPSVMLKKSPLHVVSHTSVFSDANCKSSSSSSTDSDGHDNNGLIKLTHIPG